MTTGYIGADPDQLDTLGQTLLTDADALETMRAKLTGDLYHLGWEGPDADDVRAEWETLHAPALGSASELLRAMSQSLIANAGQQRDTSSSLGASPSGAGPLGRVPPPGLSPQELRDYWVNLAAQNAGIDLSQWDPHRGSGELSGIIENVYTYYGNLYLDHPYLQWAGMANMIGPSFAAGFYDLDLLRRVAQSLRGQPGMPPGLDVLAHCTDAELRFYETTFLTMQKEIFLDQAMMHEAYLNGGMDSIHRLREAGLIDTATENAWAQIDQGRRTGDLDLLAEGNTVLLYREQHDIIDSYYQRMYDHPVTGPAFTYLMTAVGEPSIPGAQSFADYKPLVVTIESPGPQNIPFTPWDNPLQVEVNVRTPLPDGNIAHFDDRWDYITSDTLPAYQDLLRNDPQQAAQIIGTGVGGRIDDYRLHHRIDSLVEHYATDWGVDVDQ